MSEQLKEDIKTINFLIVSAKEDFFKYITNKEVPLSERWELFTQAPSYLKEHSGMMEHFQVLDNLGIDYFDEMYYEKYERIETYSLAERLEEELLGEKGLTQEKIDEVKEQILEQNLGSFDLDW